MCKDELIARKKIFIRFFSIKFNFVYNIFVNFFFFSWKFAICCCFQLFRACSKFSFPLTKHKKKKLLHHYVAPTELSSVMSRSVNCTFIFFCFSYRSTITCRRHCHTIAIAYQARPDERCDYLLCTQIMQLKSRAPIHVELF